MAAAPRSETERVVVKNPLEERIQELANHLLSNSVAYGGDSQRSRFTVSFGDVGSA
jgi:uncharacterized protein (DUF2461 family)